MNAIKRLKQVTDDDHAWLVDLHNDPEVLRNLTNPSPITLDQHLLWWEKTRNDPRQLRLIFVVEDEPVGFTKFYDIDNVNQSCALGADIHKKHRGKGHAREMWRLMLNMSFLTLNVNRASLTTAEFNHVGQHVYRSLGFKEEGRLHKSLCRNGQFYDQICMYMLRENWSM